MDELTWLQQRESMLQHTSSLKGVLIVSTEIFKSRHRNKLNREKLRYFVFVVLDLFISTCTLKFAILLECSDDPY